MKGVPWLQMNTHIKYKKVRREPPRSWCQASACGWLAHLPVQRSCDVRVLPPTFPGVTGGPVRAALALGRDCSARLCGLGQGQPGDPSSRPQVPNLPQLGRGRRGLAAGHGPYRALPDLQRPGPLPKQAALPPHCNEAQKAGDGEAGGPSLPWRSWSCGLVGSLPGYKGGHGDSLGPRLLLAGCGGQPGTWGFPWARRGRGTHPGHLRQCWVIAGIRVAPGTQTGSLGSSETG